MSLLLNHIGFLHQICSYKAKDITPSIAWRKEDRRMRKRSMICKRVTVNWTKTGTVSEVILETLPTNRVERICCGFFPQHINTILNYGESNWTHCKSALAISVLNFCIRVIDWALKENNHTYLHKIYPQLYFLSDFLSLWLGDTHTHTQNKTSPVWVWLIPWLSGFCLSGAAPLRAALFSVLSKSNVLQD